MNMPRVWAALGVLAGLSVLILLWDRGATPKAPSAARSSTGAEELGAQLLALQSREAEVARTTWAPELLAERCGAVFEALWDALNAATNQLAVLREFASRELWLPSFGPPQSAGLGIELFQPTGTARPATPEEWRQRLDQLRGTGWELLQTEFRHNQFVTNALGQARESTFYFRADLVNRRAPARATLEGDLVVTWADGAALAAPPVVDRIDGSHLRLLTCPGPPPFERVLLAELAPEKNAYFIDPLILQDLDGDGLSEIILAAKNLVFKRRADGHFTSRPLCRTFPGSVLTAVIADFDGDGVADLLCAVADGLLLFKGSPGGAFEEPGRLVWCARPRLRYAQVLTCGDIDEDGDLDVFLGQYKSPYERGQMPSPYYDANDGHPAHLLVNDGHGNFSEATEAAGLGPKRFRRCYSASFVDLNEDGHLDLLVVGDFAGVDLYANDGHGHFTDVTDRWLPEHHLFGMSHTCADFDLDGHLDFLVMGMNVPTAQRLDHLGLERPGSGDYAAFRPRMTVGNRLFQGKPGGGFRTGPLGASISRSGWSWGCTAFDCDNDGYPDVYITAGHVTRQSVRDYETEFWLHDIYVGKSADSAVNRAYFDAKFAQARAQGWSYGGYEKNRLFLNRGGESFLEVGHLFGLALEQDSRGLVADDLEGDGRVDLIFTTFEVWPQERRTLQVFRNHLESTGHWIGFRLRGGRQGASPIGAKVTLRYDGRTVVHQLVTGDSYRSQRANTVHFGLGSHTEVQDVEIRLPNGRTLRLDHPPINRYHTINLAP